MHLTSSCFPLNILKNILRISKQKHLLQKLPESTICVIYQVLVYQFIFTLELDVNMKVFRSTCIAHMYITSFLASSLSFRAICNNINIKCKMFLSESTCSNKLFEGMLGILLGVYIYMKALNTLEHTGLASVYLIHLMTNEITLIYREPWPSGNTLAW